MLGTVRERSNPRCKMQKLQSMQTILQLHPSQLGQIGCKTRCAASIYVSTVARNRNMIDSCLNTILR